jgi:hypothetical protein
MVATSAAHLVRAPEDSSAVRRPIYLVNRHDSASHGPTGRTAM